MLSPAASTVYYKWELCCDGLSFKVSVCPTILASVVDSTRTVDVFLSQAVCPATAASTLALTDRGFLSEALSWLTFPSCSGGSPRSRFSLGSWVTLRVEPLSCTKNLILLSNDGCLYGTYTLLWT